MEGNTITSFENLCKIFEMRIKLDKEKNINTSLDVLNNYEKYSKKIDSIYNSAFQKELKPLISPAVTLEKEEDRLRRLIKLLEERLDRRIELEDKFYEYTGKYISGLQMIVSESELEEKKERLSIVSNYLETSREIENITENLNKLKDSLEEEENKKEEYESKNKIMEDELYSSFMKVIEEDDYYRNINEEDINNELDSIRSKVSETKETLDITKESIGSLMTNGLEDDYTSYVEEAEKNYFKYKNKEIILKIYKLVINFEEDFKLMCSKRESINQLLEEKKNVREDLSISTEDELVSFEKTLLLQIKTLENEREVLENIANYISRIKFKEERLEELKTLNNSAETLVILREYGLVDTYDTEDISDVIIEEELIDNNSVELQEIELPKDEEPISETVYDPYRIVEVKDYPKTLNVGLAKLKGESVREKVNKKLNPKSELEFNDFIEKTNNNLINDTINKETNITDSSNIDTNTMPIVNENISNNIESPIKLDSPSIALNEVKSETPVWSLPTENESKNINLENVSYANNLPLWETIEPSYEMPQVMENKEEITSINITPSITENNNNDNMFWVPVSDSKLEIKDFPNLNIPISSNLNEKDNFTFPTINN